MVFNNIEPNQGKIKNDVDFLDRIFNHLRQYVIRCEQGKDKVVNFKPPHKLMGDIDAQLGHDGVDFDSLYLQCENIIDHSVRTGHPMFFNQLFAKVDNVSLAGSWITSALNTSQYTFEVAPCFTLIEQQVLNHMAQKIGYTEYDGIFCPGGSISNMYGLNLARSSFYPDVKNTGMKDLPRLAIFLSDQAHYSFKKGAALLGFGINSLFIVKTKHGKMCLENLEETIQKAKFQGFKPMVVVATCGTTVVGAFDPVDEISAVCKNHKMWLHVDACLGGSALLSKTYYHLLKGIEKSDSVSWNCHKVIGASFQCCAFFTSHADLLKFSHATCAKYLFQEDKFYDISYDTGDKSIQCGRVVDALKLWIMWKKLGDVGLEKRVDEILNIAKFCETEVERRENFVLVNEPTFINVCFYYTPNKLSRFEKNSDKYNDILSKITPYIKEKLVVDGISLIGYQPLLDKVNFFRFVICYSPATSDHVSLLLDKIQQYGEEYDCYEL